MNIQLTTLCDSASDYQGKLCILGSFDSLFAQEFPVTHPQCALALRLHFDTTDIGQHQLFIEFKSAAGEDVIPPFSPTFEINFPPNSTPFITRNVILNLNALKFEQPGVYTFKVRLDNGETSSLPLRVTQIDASQFPNQQPAG